MKLKFKKQDYQTRAVDAVVDCFEGQPKSKGITHRIDPGLSKKKQADIKSGQMSLAWSDDVAEDDSGFKNADLLLTDAQLLENIQNVQRRQNLPVSPSLSDFKTIKRNELKSDKTYTKQALQIAPYHLDIEMETGTGKTYCYIKMIFEMNRRYGWTKFVIVVPSIAIREGVYKSLEITADHFQETYNKRAKFFIYNSKQLHNLESFSSDAGINVMIINVQAFNATGKDARRIYEELDDFQSRRPIDVIKANRPILILDEPQKMEGKKTLASLTEFNPLMVLRYSATHKTQHNKIHRLDALDAYNQRLVKKIAVRGISVKGLPGTNAYLYLESIEISRQTPKARMEVEVKQSNGIKRVIRKLKKGDNLFDESGQLDQYKGFVISEIDANRNAVEFTNGHRLYAGEATGDVNEMTLRRIQIREAIQAHFEQEQDLFHQSIKVLTLFFIDEVAKYRVYNEEGEPEGGEYAQIFEEEYANCLNEMRSSLLPSPDYKKHVEGISIADTHNGYFSIDKKGKLVDPKMTATEKKRDESSDDDAYDLILKDKERLLSFEEPTRFIFSHSALREGWDNPNIFVICTLKHSDNTISRRQEVGRGLRIAVNQLGERQDDPATVHQTNVLTVVASESYKDFVAGLQRDISESLSERPRKADEDYFTGKVIPIDGGTKEITPELAKKIYRYLLKNDYTDDTDQVTQAYHDAKRNETLAPLPDELKPYQDQIIQLIDGVYSDALLPSIEDDKNNKPNRLNDNFEKKEFKELWNRINRKAIYSVHFDSPELIEKCVAALNAELTVAPLQYTVQLGEQLDEVSIDQLKDGDSFAVRKKTTESKEASVHSTVKYDLVGKIAELVHLTRKSVGEILTQIWETTFAKYRVNPESFISEASRLINEQKATLIVEHLAYDSIGETHDIDIFTDGQAKLDFSKAGEQLQRHIYDYVITDSKGERSFVQELDTCEEVVVYAKLPRGFFIPTPVGNYNPDWAISFKEGAVKHVYFVAETKGSMSSMELRKIEESKIECARKFFKEINRRINPEHVKYDVVNSFAKLMEVVGV